MSDGVGDEPHTFRGVIDRPVMIELRDVFNREDGIAEAELDDFVSPTRLHVHFQEGIEGARGRLDVRWTTADEYSFHYTERRGIDCRWDRHPHGGNFGPREAHFHPPPTASSDPERVERSCIEVAEPSRVGLAVLTLWRAAHASGSLEPLNSLSNPP